MQEKPKKKHYQHWHRGSIPVQIYLYPPELKKLEQLSKGVKGGRSAVMRHLLRGAGKLDIREVMFADATSREATNTPMGRLLAQSLWKKDSMARIGRGIDGIGEED